MLELVIRRKDVSAETVLRQEITPAQLSIVKLLLASNMTFGEALRVIPKSVPREFPGVSLYKIAVVIGDIAEADIEDAQNFVRQRLDKALENHDAWYELIPFPEPARYDHFLSMERADGGDVVNEHIFCTLEEGEYLETRLREEIPGWDTHVEPGGDYHWTTEGADIRDVFLDIFVDYGPKEA